MAEITPDSSLAEVISSLDLGSVPEKLHCSTCHGFLLNAYKTSCCEQNVCEKCFSDITDRCPMCQHKPFSKELCRPAKAMRNTVKAYLRNIEKSLAEERARVQPEQTSTTQKEKPEDAVVADAQASANQDVLNGKLESVSVPPEDLTQDASGATNIQPSIEVEPDHVPQPGISKDSDHEDEVANRQTSVESDDNDDEVEIQVEPSAEDDFQEMQQNYGNEEQEQQYDNSVMELAKNGDTGMHDMSNGMDMNGFNMQNMNMMGFNGMGMEMMQQMMNGNMNMMMPLGMGPMFGGFGGSNGMMNGMNMMGMNFNSNQMFNGWNGQNSNMWQNNNAMNAIGGDFGSSFGSNMSQQGNFYSQQFPNGDFNGYNGRYGRGRGRGGRGFYGRGRGSFNQYQQNSGYHNAHEQQQQYDTQSSHSQINEDAGKPDDVSKGRANQKEEEVHQNEFAPGGQDEVKEALGHDEPDAKTKTKTNESSPKTSSSQLIDPVPTQPETQPNAEPVTNQEQLSQNKIIPEAYHEDFDTMAPPSAPTGPSGRYSDKEIAFRARGHGKYSARSRGSFSASAGFPASPIRSISQSSLTAPSPPSQGVGVVGAPTGPRAMREPQVPKQAPRTVGHSNGGFQIMGRASMQSNASRSKEDEQPRSVSPTNGYNDQEDGRSSRRHSKYEKYGETRNEADSESNYDHDRHDRDRDRQSRRSKRTDHDNDYDMDDMDEGYESPDRRSSLRSSRYDKERSRKDDKYSSSTKHRSSRRHYDDEAESEYDQDDYGEPVSDRYRSSKSGKSASKHDSARDREKDSQRDRKRDRDRDRERERERDRDKERDRDRDNDRPKDRDDRHRKRSRHDRDHDDDYNDPDDEESRHRSRRHKKDHQSSSRRDRDREAEDPDLGLRISGRSNSNRQSALPTPTSATSSLPPTSFADSDKDPHTLEREARNRERMLKEQQRREKAALEKRGNTTGGKSNRTTASSGRRVSYKYEDEVERGMGAADEREKARWR